MSLARPACVCLLLALAGLGASLPAAQVGARPKLKEPPIPFIDAPPPMPNVGLGARFLTAASAYENYMRRARSISPAFVDGAGVAQSLQAGAAYEPIEFLRGEIAYAAIAALQDPTFVASVRAAGHSPEERYAILVNIFADPANAFKFNGAADAAGLAKEALAGEGMSLFNAGKSVKQAAYDIQKQPWSLEEIANRDARLEGVKSLSAAPMAIAPDETAALERASDGESTLPLTPDPASPPYRRLIVRAVALAALAAIGEAGDDHADSLAWVTDDYFTSHCLAEAKAMLNECLAVAKPNYEDVFCLGQHAMTDTGACVVKGAGSTVPLEIYTKPLKIAPVHTARRTRRRR